MHESKFQFHLFCWTLRFNFVDLIQIPEHSFCLAPPTFNETIFSNLSSNKNNQKESTIVYKTKKKREIINFKRRYETPTASPCIHNHSNINLAHIILT